MAELMNKIMKKNLFIAAAMVAAMTSCVKETGIVEPQETEKVWVEFAAGVQTKVTLTDGETDTVTWDEDDKISINGVEFSIPDNSDFSGGETATFGAFVEPSFLEAVSFTAVYPVDAVTWVEGAPQVTVPAVQDGKANIIAMANAVSLEEPLNFKHVVSFIKFQVSESVTSVTISADQAVAGKVKEVTFAEVESVTTVSYEAVEGQTADAITVSLGADASFQPGTVYYAAVLPGAKTNFTLSFGEEVYKTWATLDIKQGRILNVQPKADRGLAYKLDDEVVETVAYILESGEFKAPVLTGVADGVTYTSSVADVATVSETGEVTVRAAGTTVITASAAENNTHLAGSASYTLTVSDKAVREISFASTAASATLGAEFTAPVLNGVENEDVVTYSSTVETVATVDPSTGAVTLKGTGETVITATVSATATHKEATATYTLTVTKEVRTLTFSPESVEVTYADDLNVTEPTLNGLKAEETVTYASSDETVATVDASTGAVTVLKAGSTTITATLAATDNHDGATASYTLTINKAERTVAFNESSKSVTYGDDVQHPELTETTASDQVTYSIAEGDAATVTEAGVVTLVKAGTVTIKATVAATPTHNSCEAEYTLTINKAERTVAFNESSKSVTYGDEVQHPALTGTTASDQVTYSIAEGDAATITEAGVVTLVKAGTVTIKATVAATSTHNSCEAEYTLTINKAERNLEFSTTSAEATYGKDFVEPTLNGVTDGVTYESTDSNVATVDSKGNITLKGMPGEVTITASADESATHKSASVTYKLKVERKIKIYVYLYPKEKGWGEWQCNPYIYYFGSTTISGSSWPGVEMQKTEEYEGKKRNYYEFNYSATDKISVVITNNNHNNNFKQTVDIKDLSLSTDHSIEVWTDWENDGKLKVGVIK